MARARATAPSIVAERGTSSATGSRRANHQDDAAAGDLSTLDNDAVELRGQKYEEACRLLRFVPDFDLFATPRNAKTGFYFTVRDNAFSKPWGQLGMLYLNPPWRLLGS